MLLKQNSGSPDEDKEPDSSSPLHDFSQVQRQAEETLRRFAYLIREGASEIRTAC
jgi:hypothetical protein